MNTSRRRSAKNSHTPALVTGFVAGVAIVFGVLAVPTFDEPRLALPSAKTDQSGGHSVHLKNRGTPKWMRELQARQAQPPPVTAERHVPSFWI